MIVVVCSASIATAAPPAPDVRSDVDPSDIRAGMELLAGVEDETFSFDDEGFYWFCRYLRKNPEALSTAVCAANDVVPWHYLMERPSDYRGRAVCIEGRFLREQPEYEVVTRPGVGRLRQIDLGTPGSGAIATLVLVDPPPNTPRKSLIRVRGIFIKVRSYRTESGDDGAGPLLVATTFDVIEAGRRDAAIERGMSGRDILTAMAGLTVVLFLLVVMMRKRAAVSTSMTQLPVDRPRVSGTAVDFDWMGQTSQESTSDEPTGRS